jgi:aquaporin Z
MNSKSLAAEFIGTFALVAAVCGAGVLASPAGGGRLAVAFAVGLSIMVMGYALGHISGGHFNPAVTIGLIAGGRFDTGSAIGYIIAQVLGAFAAVLLFQVIQSGALTAGPGATTRWGSFATISNTYGGAYGFSMIAALVTEVAATAIYLVIFMGSTSVRASAGLAPLAIGGGVLVLHLIAIPVTNASFNPARSTAPAVLAGGVALSQLWLFWVAPIVGGIIGGAVGRWLDDA